MYTNINIIFTLSVSNLSYRIKFQLHISLSKNKKIKSLVLQSS